MNRRTENSNNEMNTFHNEGKVGSVIQESVFESVLVEQMEVKKSIATNVVMFAADNQLVRLVKTQTDNE